MEMIVPLRRFGYRAAYAALRLYSFLARPHTRGVKCVLTDGDRVLLVRHSYGKRRWELPGGSIKRGEAPATAATREMEEELGVSVDSWRLLAEIELAIESRRDHVHFFAAEVHAPELTIDHGELTAAAWFRRDELPRVGRYTRQILAVTGDFSDHPDGSGDRPERRESTPASALSSSTIREVRFNTPAVTRLLADWDDEMRARVPGFSPSGGSTVDVGDFEAPNGAFLISEWNGTAVGCGGFRRLTDGIGEVKRVFVSRSARRQGVGRALLLAIEDHARSLGYRTLRLDTDGGESGAIGLFRSLGYEPIDDYNDNPYARYWFEKKLA